MASTWRKKDARTRALRTVGCFILYPNTNCFFDLIHSNCLTLTFLTFQTFPPTSSHLDSLFIMVKKKKNQCFHIELQLNRRKRKYFRDYINVIFGYRRNEIVIFHPSLSLPFRLSPPLITALPSPSLFSTIINLIYLFIKNNVIYKKCYENYLTIYKTIFYKCYTL